jgi:ribosome maturation factor RimP
MRIIIQEKRNKSVKINGTTFNKYDFVNIWLTDGQFFKGHITKIENDKICLFLNLLNNLINIHYEKISTINLDYYF